MDLNNQQQLIDKYWEGATNIEEERQLKIFFAESGQLPEELEQWRPWFSRLAEIDQIAPGEDFDVKILNYIEKKPARRSTSLFRIIRPWTAAAACLAGLIISLSCWKYISFQKEKQEKIALEQAQHDYETVKKTLLFASSQLNMAQDLMQENFSKINVINEYINIK